MESVPTNGPGNIRGLRLLPWAGADGKPAYTPDDNPDGLIAQMADARERAQLSHAADLNEIAREALSADAPLSREQARYLLVQLSGALTNTLRVAESRGMRLPQCDPEDTEPGDDTEPTAARNG